MGHKSLVDSKTLAKFGKSNSLNVDLLIESIKSLNKKLPNLNSNSPFVDDKKRNFEIKLNPQDTGELSENINPYFSNCINWKSPRTQFNITPPVTILSVAASSIASLLNPNAVWDFACGGFGELEREIVKYLAKLVSWENASGVFVFGGTATNMYGIKLGINKCNGMTFKKGINKNIYVISNEEGHSCHLTVSNWLGIGTDKCIRLKTDQRGIVDKDEVLNKAEELIKKGKKVGCIILNAGTNFNGRFDPIKEVKEGIDKLVKKYNLHYVPHIHADSVIGWVFLLFKGYDFNRNELKFPEIILDKIKSIYSKAIGIKFADSFGVDFHKSGFCPYLSSVFITKESKDWNKITGNSSIFTHQAFNFGEYRPGQYTLETSRPVNGAITAYATLNSLGINGIRRIIANFLYVSNDLREKIDKSNNLINCNRDADGWATIFLAKGNSNYKSFNEIYNDKNKKNIESINNLQKGFYDFLIRKYKAKSPWIIGYATCYKRNRFGFQISALKNFPMSPFITIKDNQDYMRWLNKNLEEYLNGDYKFK